MVIEVPVEKIFSVTNESELEARREELKLLKGESIVTGWENITAVGFLHGEGDTYFSATTTNGAWLGDRLFFGLGLGWDHFPGGNMVPIFACAKTETRWKFFRPFGFVEAGYSLGFLEGRSGSGNGGFNLCFGAGTKIDARTFGALPLIQAGLRVQGAKEFDLAERRSTVTYTFISVMAGVAF